MMSATLIPPSSLRRGDADFVGLSDVEGDCAGTCLWRSSDMVLVVVQIMLDGIWFVLCWCKLHVSSPWEPRPDSCKTVSPTSPPVTSRRWVHNYGARRATGI